MNTTKIPRNLAVLVRYDFDKNSIEVAPLGMSDVFQNGTMG